MANLAYTEMYIIVNNKEEQKAVTSLINGHLEISVMSPDDEEDEENHPLQIELGLDTNWGLPTHFFEEVLIVKFPHVKWNATATEPGNSHRALAEYRPDQHNFIEPTQISYYESNL